MGTIAKVDISGMENLTAAMDAYGAGAGQIVEDVLKNDAFDRIAGHIPGLIHPSGRTWRGKATSATQAPYASVFKGTVSDMTLTIESQKKYNYLYFPDDGSTSKRHAGGQDFMLRGAQDEMDNVTSEILDRLTAAFEEG